MIDVSNIRASGWNRVVEELASPAADDRLFLARLASVLGRVSSARLALLFRVPMSQEGTEPDHEQPPELAFIWPAEHMLKMGAKPDLHARVPDGIADQVEAIHDQRIAARSVASGPAASCVRVFRLEEAGEYYTGSGGKGMVIAVTVPLVEVPNEPAPLGDRHVVTILIENRSQQALHTTLAMIESLVGYAHTHVVRQVANRTKQSSAALDLAGRLIASINTATGFKGACMQVANDLSRYAGADRVTIGWAASVGNRANAGQACRAVAMSDTEHLDRRTNLIQRIEAAMDECLDQEQPVVYPQPPEAGEGGDALLGRAIVHSHRELASADARLKIASVPLRIDEGVVGVVTIESTYEGQASPTVIEMIQATLDLVSPVLVLRKSDDRVLPLRAWDESLKVGAWAVGPKHTAWKLGAIALGAFALFATLVPLPYRVEAPMELRPVEERMVSVPFGGILSVLPVGIEPGVTVLEGDLLAHLDTSEMLDRLAESMANLELANKQADAARNAGTFDDEDQARARATQAIAQIDVINQYLSRADIRAPISGTIIAGDLASSVGQTLQQGQPLFQIAQLDGVVVVARVRDEDIKLVNDRLAREGEVTGYMATKAQPGKRVPIVVERVVPSAQPIDGQNVFEVYARLADDAQGSVFRPGLEGIVKLDSDRRPLIDIVTRRLRNRIRLWMWW